MQSEMRLVYAKFYSRSHDPVIRVYDEAGNVIETHEHAAVSKSRERLGLLCSANAFVPLNIAIWNRARANLRAKSSRDAVTSAIFGSLVVEGVAICYVG